MKAKVLNFDEVYTSVKGLASGLNVTGWDADYGGVYFNDSDSLLGWFLKNITSLKTGVNDLLVASAYGDGNGYTLYEDRVLITTEKTESGLLVVVTVECYEDNGYHDYSGRYSVERREEKTAFLLKYEE